MNAQASAPDRPWWKKILEFPLVAMVIGIAVMIGTIRLAGEIVNLLSLKTDIDTKVMIVDVIAVIGLFLAYKLIIRHLGRRKHDDLAFDGALKETGAGLGIGFALFTLVVGVAALVGVYRITGQGDFSFFVSALITNALFPAVSEEMLFRGVLFRWLEEFGGSWVALLLTSALFGAAHLANPNASPVAAIGIALEAGVMLGAAYMLTRRLWLAMGLHAAWNFTQGAIWDIPVSGLPVRGLVEAELKGPPLLTGNNFGLEASLIAIVIATAFGLYLLARAIREGQLVHPMWVKAKDMPAVEEARV